MEHWMHSVAGLHRDSLIWILYLADHPREVTVNKSSDFGTQRGRVERYAQELGIEDFDARVGFRKLLSSTVLAGKRTGKILMDDKSDESIKFTKDVGRFVFSSLRSNQEFRQLIEEKLGIDDGKETWFPFKISKDAKIEMTGYCPETDGEFTRFIIKAALKCARCAAEVEHEYPAVWSTDAWSEVQVKCRECGHENSHYKVGPGVAPW